MRDVLVGVVSDTHGLLRPEVKRHLQRCDEILHAGDLEDPFAVMVLGSIAKVTAVRGNCDGQSPLPKTQLITIAGRSIYLLHDLDQLDLDPVAAGIQVVISGHTHRAKSELKDGVLYFNPGSASRPRWGGSASMGLLRFEETAIVPQILPLSP